MLLKAQGQCGPGMNTMHMPPDVRVLVPVLVLVLSKC